MARGVLYGGAADEFFDNAKPHETASRHIAPPRTREVASEGSIMAKKNSSVAVETNGKASKAKHDDETPALTADAFDVTITRLTGGRWRVAVEGGEEHPELAGEVLTVQTVKSLDGIGDTIDGLLAELCE